MSFFAALLIGALGAAEVVNVMNNRTVAENPPARGAYRVGRGMYDVPSL